jgi:hypothetical protein
MSQTNSRSPSVASERAPSQSPRRNRKGRPRELSTESDRPVWLRTEKTASGLNPVEENTRDVAEKARAALTRLREGPSAGQGGSEEEEQDKILKLRLDLNLDVYVKLKAKIHGDLTLQLLYVRL